MKAHSINSLVRACLILLLIMLGACTPTPPPEEVKPPTEATTSEPEQIPPTEVTVPEPESFELRAAEFDGTVKPDQIGDLPVFVGVGQLTNDQDQTLVMTVIGSSEGSVREYFSTARFYFEIRDPIDLPLASDTPEQFPDLSHEEILGDTEAENLYIDFELSSEMKEAYPTGNVLLIADPSVRAGQYNNYAAKDPASNAASVTMTVSEGSVEGRLYLRCSIVSGPKTASPNYPKTLNGSGNGYFDLTVKGSGSGGKYKLTGTWNYDYTTYVPSEPSPKITC